MSDLDLTQVVDATKHVLAAQRGFDDKNGWENEAVWDRAVGNPEEGTRAILAMTADICGYYASAGLDLADDHDRDALRWIAGQLGEVVAALRATLARGEAP